jgi:inorganic pyrophosphatase
MNIRHKTVHPWHDISPGENAPEEITAFIEVSKGSMLKYELDKKSGFIKLDRVLYSAVHYPGDYGFIPQTISEDGDPTDVIIINNFAINPGTLVTVRPIGILEMIDGGERDEKIICVPAPSVDPRFAKRFDIEDFSEHVILEIKHFFETYKQLQGKEVEIRGVAGNEAAKKAIQEAIALYKEQSQELQKE